MLACASMPLLVAALSGTIPVPVGTIGPECQVWELVIGPHYTHLLNISSKKSAQQHMNTCLARACTVTHLPHHRSELRRPGARQGIDCRPLRCKRSFAKKPTSSSIRSQCRQRAVPPACPTCRTTDVFAAVAVECDRRSGR